VEDKKILGGDVMMGAYIAGIPSTYDGRKGTVYVPLEKSEYIRVPIKSYWEHRNRIEVLEEELIEKDEGASEKDKKIFELSAEVVSLKLLLDCAMKQLEILEDYHTLVLDYKELLEKVLMSEGRMIFK
jgi:hypothetical protein